MDDLTTIQNFINQSMIPNDANLQKPSLALTIIRVSTLIILAVLGIAGNVLVICVIGRYKNLRIAVNVFVGNLALSNTVLCVLGLFMVSNVIANK